MEARDDQTTSKQEKLKLTVQQVAGLVQSQYVYVRRSCKDLFVEGHGKPSFHE